MHQVAYYQRIVAEAIDGLGHVNILKNTMPPELLSGMSGMLYTLEKSYISIQSDAKALYRSAITDELTELRTRVYLEDVLEKEFKDAGKLGCLFIDIDHFKRQNDWYGHLQGDHALKTITAVIRRYANPELIVRYGGEEFVAFYTYTGLTCENLLERGESIRRAIEDTIVLPYSIESIISEMGKRNLIVGDRAVPHLQGFFQESTTASAYYETMARSVILPLIHQDINPERLHGIIEYLQVMQRMTVSIGGAMRKDGESFTSLIERADAAMYAVKQTTRNAVKVSVA